MFAQIVQQSDLTWRVTATTSHQPTPEMLPPGVRSVEIPDDVTVVGGETFEPSEDNPDVGAFVAPAAPPAPAATVSVAAFLKAVTDAEWAAFAAAADSNAAFSRAKAILDHTLTITPTDGYFVEMMNAAVSAGILTSKRQTAIMAALTA